MTYASITDLGKWFMDVAFSEYKRKVDTIFDNLLGDETEVAIDLFKKIGKHAKIIYIILTIYLE